MDVRLMRLSPQGLDLIKKHEGFRPYAYDDFAPNRPARRPIQGTLTIGYGETLGVRMGDTITEEAASERLNNRLRRDFEPAIHRLVRVPLTQYQYDALVCFVYNIGEGALADSTLLRRLNQGRYDDVPAQLMRWTKSKGRELRGLVRRRRDEAELWRGLVEAPPVETVPIPMPADPPADGTPASRSTTVGAATVTGAATTVATVTQVARETTENGVGIMTALGDLWPLAVAAIVVAGCAAWIIRERRRHAREDGV
ncbi:lysozyme [Ahrensia marina]|uniref:lysozyme n=1 Tax=Ahrensia marina TaxID=1514904 RepID=UPI0035D0FF86